MIENSILFFLRSNNRVYKPGRCFQSDEYFLNKSGNLIRRVLSYKLLLRKNNILLTRKLDIVSRLPETMSDARLKVTTETAKVIVKLWLFSFCLIFFLILIFSILYNI